MRLFIGTENITLLNPNHIKMHTFISCRRQFMPNSLFSHRQQQKHIHQKTASFNSSEGAYCLLVSAQHLRTSRRHHSRSREYSNFCCLFSSCTGPSFLINKITFENFTLDYTQYAVSCCLLLHSVESAECSEVPLIE